MRLRDCKVGMRVRIKGGAWTYLIGVMGTIGIVGVLGVQVLFRFKKADLSGWFYPRNLEPAPAQKGR